MYSVTLQYGYMFISIDIYFFPQKKMYLFSCYSLLGDLNDIIVSSNTL